MAIPLIVWGLAAAGAALLGGCSKPRRREEREGDPPDHIYRTVRPILDRNCVPCHNPTQASANYDLSYYVRVTPEGYDGILGNGTDDTPNAIAGQPGSMLLVKLNDAQHRSYLTSEERDTLTHWVVQDRLARFWISGMHPPGWLNPQSPDFHGEDLAQNNWEMAPCRECHGDDGEEGGRYGGGKVTAGFGDSVQSCVQCHGESPESCTTCHGQSDDPAPPRSLRWEGSLGAAAHQSHLYENVLSDPVPCETCHTVPEQFDASSHIDSDRPAEVTFGGLSNHNGFAPVWDRMMSSCSSVYCHLEATPVWTEVDGSHRTCTSCHSTHPGGVNGGGCSTCHGAVVNDTETIINPSLHVNGSVQVGRNGDSPDSLACNSCHNLEANPPVALDWSGSLGPAAHRAHLTTALATSLECEECHQVPDSLFSTGHIDTPLPAEVIFAPGSRAGLNGIVPSWGVADATCIAYCHSPTSAAPSPAWDDPAVVIGCSSCHGAPPPSPHPQVLGVENCLLCHGDVTDEEGNILRPDKHMDGNVNYTF